MHYVENQEIGSGAAGPGRERIKRNSRQKNGGIPFALFWTKTEFFNRAVKTDEDPVVKKYIAMYDPKDILMDRKEMTLRKKHKSEI